jgi:hypothetical protein
MALPVSEVDEHGRPTVASDVLRLRLGIGGRRQRQPRYLVTTIGVLTRVVPTTTSLSSVDVTA